MDEKKPGGIDRLTGYLVIHDHELENVDALIQKARALGATRPDEYFEPPEAFFITFPDARPGVSCRTDEAGFRREVEERRQKLKKKR